MIHLLNEYSNKRSHEYIKDHHYNNVNVFNTSFKVKYPLNSVLSYNKLSPKHILLCLFFHMLNKTLILKL